MLSAVVSVWDSLEDAVVSPFLSVDVSSFVSHPAKAREKTDKMRSNDITKERELTIFFINVLLFKIFDTYELDKKVNT